jgi:hypothetical protein
LPRLYKLTNTLRARLAQVVATGCGRQSGDERPASIRRQEALLYGGGRRPGAGRRRSVAMANLAGWEAR